MRIGVLKLSAAQQRAALFKHGDDDRVRGTDLHSFEGRRLGRVPGSGIDVDVPGGIDAAGGVETVLLTGIKVVGAVRRRGMHRTGSGVGGDVGGQHAQDRPLQKRMLKGNAVERRALEAGKLFGGSELASLGHLCRQLGGHNVHEAIR